MLIMSFILWAGCLAVATPVISSRPNSSSSFSTLGSSTGPASQKPLRSDGMVDSHINYSVGFSLSTSYGSAAVIIESSGGRKETRTWTVQGGQLYEEVMVKLSQPSSRHYAAPYNSEDDMYKDIPRLEAREARKRAGLPASDEVGALAEVLKKLRALIEHDLGIVVSSATVAAPHLVALYRDDMQDVCANAGFRYVIPKFVFRPILWEAGAAYRGYGFGLCENWRNDKLCARENNAHPDLSILAVHYSRNALTTTLADISRSTLVWDPDTRRVEDFTLGSDAVAGYQDPEDYWGKVKEVLLRRMLENPTMNQPDRIIFTGDKVDPHFVKFASHAVQGHLGRRIPVYADDAAVVAAKGAAELMRRGRSPFI